jgi:hypothetical protein
MIEPVGSVVLLCERGEGHRHMGIALARSRLLMERSLWIRHGVDRKYGGFIITLIGDGSISVPLKGDMWKGPFQVPFMQWNC